MHLSEFSHVMEYFSVRWLTCRTTRPTLSQFWSQNPSIDVYEHQEVRRSMDLKLRKGRSGSCHAVKACRVNTKTTDWTEEWPMCLKLTGRTRSYASRLKKRTGWRWQKKEVWLKKRKSRYMKCPTNTFTISGPRICRTTNVKKFGNVDSRILKPLNFERVGRLLLHPFLFQGIVVEMQAMATFQRGFAY